MLVIIQLQLLSVTSKIYHILIFREFSSVGFDNGLKTVISESSYELRSPSNYNIITVSSNILEITKKRTTIILTLNADIGSIPTIYGRRVDV